jgi:histidinol-phosphate aminotransferase
VEPPEPIGAPKEPPQDDVAPQVRPELEQPSGPPSPRDAVARAYKVPRARRDRSDYLRLDLAESPRPASPRVLEAIQQLRPDALSRYPDPWPLLDALAGHHGVPTDHLTVTAGADEAIRWTFNAFLEPGARVVIPRPTFGSFLAAAEAGGAFVERVDHNADFEVSFDALVKSLSPRTPRMLCLANPNAPTGTALQSSALLELAQRSPETLILVNESFVAFHGHSLLDEGAGADLPPNMLVLRSFSKDFGLAGLRVGYLLGHPGVISAIDLARPSFTLSSASIAAGLAALGDLPAMEAHVRSVKEALARLAAKLETREIHSVQTRANFLLVRLASPIQPWAAAFAAHGVLVGTTGHSGPLAPYIRVTVNDDGEAKRFLDVLDLILHMGVPGAARVRGVPGKWDELDNEGMA